MTSLGVISKSTTRLLSLLSHKLSIEFGQYASFWFVKQEHSWAGNPMVIGVNLICNKATNFIHAFACPLL